MNYEGQICRGPMERSSYMLPVAVGCSYNRCKFCTLFRHLKYRELPMEQIEAELLTKEVAYAMNNFYRSSKAKKVEIKNELGEVVDKMACFQIHHQPYK